MKKLVAALILALVPMALAACGGDEGPSKSEYIDKADAICARSDAETDRIFEEAFEDPQDPQPEEAQTAIKQSLPGVKKAVAELKDLEKPEGDEDEIDRIWTAADAGVKTIEEASATPETSLTALTTEPFAESERLATEYGMKDCGEDDD